MPQRYFKYGNKRGIKNDAGEKFDSQAEMYRWRDLKLLLAAGEISDLSRQPKFVLQAAFVRAGKKVREITYTGDFRYRDLRTGQDVVEDVKGFETIEFKIKKKMLWFLYPDIDLRLPNA